MKDENQNNSIFYIFFNKILHPFIIFGTLIFILILLIYFVSLSFINSLTLGIQSVAGTILPLIISCYILIFQKELLKKMGDINVIVSTIIALIWGFFTMVLIRFIKSYFFYIPINELVLSSTFSILLSSYVNVPSNNKIFSYYYGAVSGFLLYIIIFGFPIVLN